MAYWYLIPEAVGIGAGLLDEIARYTGASQSGWLRQTLDTLDDLSVLASLGETAGVFSQSAPVNAGVGAARAGLGIARSFVPFGLPGAPALKKGADAAGVVTRGQKAGQFVSGLMNPRAVGQALEKNEEIARAAKIGAGVARTLPGAAMTAKAFAGQPAQGFTVMADTGDIGGPGGQQPAMTMDEYAALQSIGLQNIIGQAVARYPQMWAEAERLQAMRDAEAAQNLEALRRMYMDRISQWMPVEGNYPVW